MKIPKPKLNAIELLMWGALVAAVAYMFGFTRAHEQMAPFMSHDNAETEALAAEVRAVALLRSSSKNGS